jgi:hypothetical protein
LATADSEKSSSSESEGGSDSDTDWEEIARYIFKERLKMMKTAASYEWFDIDEETRKQLRAFVGENGKEKRRL